MDYNGVKSVCGHSSSLLRFSQFQIGHLKRDFCSSGILPSTKMRVRQKFSKVI
jgi:hypothetical protein